MNDSSSPIGFVAPEPSDLAPLFPAYEIHDLIATGGMGAVYRAVQKSLDRTVAVKILPLELSEDAEFCAGFEAEAKAMARLNHPNLIGVYDFGEVNGMLFIVMEFVPGKSIHHSAHGQAIDSRDVIRLVTGICNGLAHAHENGILHRDIKPSNILLTPQAEPKIGDFGLARPVERKTQQGEVIFGTPGYTAPEVVSAPETVDHRADLFSVGILLHELLTGKLPAADLRPASQISGCDARFDAIIRRATHPAPESRYSSAAEISGDLQKITAPPATAPLAVAHAAPRGGPSRPPIPQRPTTATPKANRKPKDLSWVGLLLAIVVSGITWHFISDLKPREIVMERPAPKSSPTGKQENPPENPQIPDDSDPAEKPMPLSSQLPLPPPVSKSQESAKLEEIPVTGEKVSENGMTTVYEATDLTSLREKVNQFATVKGLVIATSLSASGKTRYITFTDRKTDSLSATMLVSEATEQYTDQKLKNYVGKKIQFSGVVKVGTAGLSINLASLSDLKILEDRQITGVASNGADSAGETRKPPSGIPSEASYHNGKWYLVYQEILPWTIASEKCRTLGGQLVVVPDEATHEFARSLAAGQPLWLGASDENHEGLWQWVDGSEMKFKKFDRNQPDNKNRARKPENHLHIRPNGLWNDVDQQSEKFGYICEWPDKPTAIVAGGRQEIRDPRRGIGPMPDLVGTWRYSDSVQLEIKPDGSVFSNSNAAGTWKQRDKRTDYFITLNDRSTYEATVDKYKRILTTRGRARGEKRTMERIDNGPTRNPEAPDQTTAWTLECRDRESDIESIRPRLEAAKRDAAEKWQKHAEAKAKGRISSWNIEAERADRLANDLARSIEESRLRLVQLKSKLGVK